MEHSGDDGGKDFNRFVAEQKLRSFSLGNMGSRGLSRKEQEEMRKKQAQEEVGKVYQEFVSTFEDNPQHKLNKTWVKAGTFNAGNRKEDATDKGTLYRPQAKLDILPRDVKPSDKAQTDANKRPEKPGKKKQETKKKSNLEIFKEELKAIQEEREERHRIKGMLRTSLGSGSSGGLASGNSNAADPFVRAPREDRGSAPALLADVSSGSHDTGDPTTTNLYLGNLSPRLTEKELMEVFGKYGPLASIKIMWPRTEDEKSRGRNCGFVAYMSRKDGERALKYLLGKDIDGFEMKMGWGKPVPIPLHPIYVPPTMLKLVMPPEPSGLPFNCQPPPEVAEKLGMANGPMPRPNLADDAEREKFHKVVHKSKVVVMIPFDRQQLSLINRMVEFVVREGPMFEAMIMNREMNNRIFRFLFDNQSPEHVYYRWRLYSLLQGDTKDDWRTEEFRMFKGGSLWKPPTKNVFNSGMPEELVEYDDSDRLRQEKELGKAPTDQRPSAPTAVSSTSKTQKGLSDSQRDRFEDMLRNLLPDRNPVAETMVWCMEHAEAFDEIVECISESLSILQTPITKKVARLYLISDILHNCSIKGVPNVSYFRKAFQAKLPEIFTDLNLCYSKIDSRIRAEAFKQRVMSCFRAWEDWAIYPQDFLIQLQNIFLGLTSASTIDDRDSDDEKSNRNGGKDEDRKSLSGEEDVDGIPLDGAALLKSAQKGMSRRHSDSDVDGAPLDEPSGWSKQSSSSRQGLPAGFVPSKWETVDPEEVQAQAVTSKWDIFDQDEHKKRESQDAGDEDDDDTDIDGVPLEDDQLDIRMSEDRRARLREVELEVMRYQDALESGKQPIKSGWTISEQVEQYRRKMVKLATHQLKDQSRPGSTPGQASSSAAGASNTPTPRRDRSSDDESRGRSSNRSRKKKRQRSRSRGRGGRSSSSSRSRSRDRKSRRTESSRRRSSSSSSDDHRSKRRRSRSPSSRKHKKKRH